MECFVVLFIVGMIAFLVYAAARARNTSESYSQLAEHHGGTCDRGGWFRRPSVAFTHAGSPVAVDVHSTGGKHPTYYTQVHFYWQRPTGRCEVYPAGIWSRVGKLLGMEDIEIGSPDFDRRYIIKGDSPAELRSLLSPSIQEQIDRLRAFLGNNNVYVSFGRRKLLVKKLSYIREYTDLLRLTELAIELYERAVVATEEGIEFVEDAAPPKLAEAVCQICGDTIESDAVFCRRCRTPHHRECWLYYGACSTYGCQETRYLRPTSRRAKRARKKMQPPKSPAAG